MKLIAFMRQRVKSDRTAVAALSQCGEGAELRKARDGDIPQLIRLHRIALRELNCAQYTSTQLDSLLLHLSPIDYVPAHVQTYFVVQVQRLIVCAGGWGLTRQPSDLGMFFHAVPANENDLATISALYTDPSWTRQGIARALLSAVEKDAQSAGHNEIGARALLSAVPFFLACGYTMRGPCQLLLPNGVSVPLSRMRKVLTQPCDWPSHQAIAFTRRTAQVEG